MNRVTFDKSKVLRLDDHARAINVASNDTQSRYTAARSRAAEATQARERREAELGRRNPRFDARGIVREPPDPELEKLRAAEAAELAEVERLGQQRDRLSARWRDAAGLIQRFKDTLRELGAPAIAELERP